MNTVVTPMTSYRPPQKLHPLSLLAQLSSRQVNGCFQVSNESASWSLHLDAGKLAYATNSIDPFERLDRHLRRLSRQVPTLVSAVRVQVRLLFEVSATSQPIPSFDYQAICWLVDQKYLHPNQAVILIEALAQEVLESFLSISAGTCQLADRGKLDEFPKFCQLDLRTLAESAQAQLQSHHPTDSTTTMGSASFSYTNGNGAMAPAPPHAAPAPKLTNTFNPELSKFRRQSEQGPTAPTPIRSSETIYKIACIDDSPTVLRTISSFLDDKAFSVVTINDPVRALMQIIRSKPDLILLDIEMPNLDGYELCSLLRRNSSFKNTPIIMVTGNTGFVDRAKAKLVRASGYLTKPFTQSDLLKIVFKHLN
ncbi:MAG: response regulator [Cyanothece sp. SIO1E1]|nr:response regulator [Cyanothece sp. SIO1E1]